MTILLRHLVQIIGGVVFLASGVGLAQDKITFKDGRTQMGQVTGFSGTALSVNIGAGTVQFPIATVDKVEMVAPAEVSTVQGADGAKAVLLLEPLVGKFKGLNVDWVVDAMSKLGDAYAADGKNDKAEALYAEMAKLYPNNRFAVKAQSGLAKAALLNKKPEEALKLLEPLIASANRSLTAPASESRFFADAFFVQGQAYESLGKFPEALESYLTVTTVFHHDAVLVKAAQSAAAQLRGKNPLSSSTNPSSL